MELCRRPRMPTRIRVARSHMGGWHLRYFEERSMKWVVENVNRAGGFLFGRRTYDVFAAHWPNASPEEQALAQPLNTLPKYVASRTLREPLAWQNSRLLAGDLAESVAALKREAGNDLLVIGSTELAAALLEHDLVDEIRLMIDPILLGGGKRFFRDDGVCRRTRSRDERDDFDRRDPGNVQPVRRGECGAPTAPPAPSGPHVTSRSRRLHAAVRFGCATSPT
jgi:dihydrofolate reductase